MNEQNIQKINEISNYFRARGFKCEREVKSIFNMSGGNILNNKTNKIDICCQKDKDIFCGEVEDTQFQCVKNKRALEQAKENWMKEGYNVSTCQLGVEENFMEVCDIPEIALDKENSTISLLKKIEPKKVLIPKKKINLGGW